MHRGSDKWRVLLVELNSATERIDPSEIEICKATDGSDLLLGTGSFGNVYKGLRGGFQEVAVKKLRCTIASDVDQMRLLKKEIVILKRASFDRNIVQYYGFCIEKQVSAMLVMEYLAVRSRHNVAGLDIYVPRCRRLPNHRSVMHVLVRFACRE